ncbi:hypothetical protein Droror1_Dr00020862 [Drosera rotundifolia]
MTHIGNQNSISHQTHSPQQKSRAGSRLLTELRRRNGSCTQKKPDTDLCEGSEEIKTFKCDTHRKLTENLDYQATETLDQNRNPRSNRQTIKPQSSTSIYPSNSRSSIPPSNPPNHILKFIKSPKPKSNRITIETDRIKLPINIQYLNRREKMKGEVDLVRRERWTGVVEA